MTYAYLHLPLLLVKFHIIISCYWSPTYTHPSSIGQLTHNYLMLLVTYYLTPTFLIGQSSYHSLLLLVTYFLTPSSPIGQRSYHSLLLLVTYLHTHTLLSYWSMRNGAYHSLLLLVAYLLASSSPIGQSSYHSLLLLTYWSPTYTQPPLLLVKAHLILSCYWSGIRRWLARSTPASWRAAYSRKLLPPRRQLAALGSSSPCEIPR